MWFELTPTREKESFLQNVFDHWSKRHEAVAIAGLPSWLAEITVDNRLRVERTRRGFGYEFTSDVEFEVLGTMGTTRYVIELKYGEKYEPLALAEVLHHAEWIRRYSGASESVVPVIIGSWNAWTRLAIASLTPDLADTKALRYYEIDLLGGGPGKLPIALIDAPLAPWQPMLQSRLPKWLKPHGERHRWHYVKETGAWVGLAREMLHRPPVLEETYVTAAPIGGSGDFLLWEGAGSKNGTPRRDADHESSYFLWSNQSCEEMSAGPRSLS